MKIHTVIYYVNYNESWEGEGFFNEKGDILHAWHGNDANWRSEYFDPIFTDLGIEINYDRADDEDLVMKLREYLGDYGDDDDDIDYYDDDIVIEDEH